MLELPGLLGSVTEARANFLAQARSVGTAATSPSRDKAFLIAFDDWDSSDGSGPATTP
jgi:hypothetical protein